jgi:hypothetical protein
MEVEVPAESPQPPFAKGGDFIRLTVSVNSIGAKDIR